MKRLKNSNSSAGFVRYLSLYKGKEEEDRVNYAPGKRICIAARLTHPVVALPDHPLFAARKEGELQFRSIKNVYAKIFRSSAGFVRYLSLYKGKEEDRVNYAPGKRICIATRFTHPVVASLNHPLFAARIEGELQFRFINVYATCQIFESA